MNIFMFMNNFILFPDFTRVFKVDNVTFISLLWIMLGR